MELPTTDRLADPQRDALYAYSTADNKAAHDSRPWAKDPRHFSTVRISSVALTKMVTHARSGGALEVMGLMQGYVDGRALVVTDAFRLPVEGTETRVNAHDEANEFMVEYLQLCRDEGHRAENVVGWYHSHPGYGCWLSGIDVGTQAMQQQWNDPFVAVVVDPDRTVSAGKVEIGAFRTFPEEYRPPPGEEGGAGGEVPLAKVEDFGAHASRYYALEVEHFKSTLDGKVLELLWNKYWVQTLAQNPLLTNREFGTSQLKDLGGRVQAAGTMVAKGAAGLGGGAYLGSRGFEQGRNVDKAMERIVKALDGVAAKEDAGLVAADVKKQLFGGEAACGCKPPQLQKEADTEKMETDEA